MLIEHCFRVIWFENGSERRREFFDRDAADAFIAASDTPVDPATLTFGEFVDRIWFPLRLKGGASKGKVRRPLSRQTRFCYGVTIREEVLPELGQIRLADLTTDEFARAMQRIRSRLAAADRTELGANEALQQAYGLASSVCRLANRLGLANVSPVERPEPIGDRFWLRKRSRGATA